ncbi:MAG: DUF2807 domain-containing protein [Bacteroidales bacterium]|nr:DUF2807 domain-containing protein [Bacteroidales bacterium]
MNTRRFFLAVLGVSLFFAPAFAQSHQVLEKQYFPPKPITGLIIDGAFSVEFTDGEPSSVTVVGAIDVVPNVVVEIISKDDETVYVKVSSDGKKNAKTSELIIDGSQLKHIEVSGIASFKTKKPIETDELTITTGGVASVAIEGTFQTVVAVATGASSIHLAGTADHITVNTSGVSEIDMADLQYGEADITASGVSRVLVGKETDNNITNTEISSIYQVGTRGQDEEDEQTSTVLSAGNVIIRTTAGSDSIVMNIAENRIIIKTNEVTIGPVKWDRKKNKFDGHWGGIGIGINGYNTADFNMDYPQEYEYLDLRFPKSIAFYLNLIELNVPLAKNQKWGMLSGLGFEWHNYRFSHDVWLGMNDGALQGYYIGGASVKKTKLMVSYVTVPLIFEFQTNNKSRINSFHAGLGVVGGVRMGTHTKAKFENRKSSYYLTDATDPSIVLPAPDEYFVSDKKKMKDYSDFYINPLKLDATACVGWGPINLFATYALTPMFRENRAPKLYPWSVGITLLGW